MSHRRVYALAVSVLLLLGLMAGTAVAAQAERLVDSAPSADGTASYDDDELMSALATSGLTQAWITSSPVSAQSSLIEITGPASYLADRGQFLTGVHTFESRSQKAADRLARLDTVLKQAEIVDLALQQLQRSLASAGDSSARLSSGEALQVQLMLTDVKRSDAWPGFSLDPISRAEHRLYDLTVDLRVALGQLTGSTASKSAGLKQITALQQTLHRANMLIDLARLSSDSAHNELTSERELLIAEMEGLHTARTLSTSVVAGLPLVTVDAYVQAAAALDSSCPVDWTLLAGIGRIESRHGTIDDATVQASGRVTTSIYGPLLDGGATAREAEEAQLAAEAEVLLAELEAELEAAEAERIAAEEAFESSVWGQLARAKDAAGLGTAPDGAQADDVEPPLHDPALWGHVPVDNSDDGPSDNSDDDPKDADPKDADGDANGEDADGDANGEDADGEDEEEEFKGNGFAVIADTDNGRLDDNSRWDRAVGPMQFIPETWSYWETDGNGDGIADPQNLYDAAASAGRFLCHLSRTRGPSPSTFVLGYNSSETYVRNVLSAAEALQGQELPDLADS